MAGRLSSGFPDICIEHTICWSFGDCRVSGPCAEPVFERCSIASAQRSACRDSNARGIRPYSTADSILSLLRAAMVVAEWSPAPVVMDCGTGYSKLGFARNSQAGCREADDVDSILTSPHCPAELYILPP